MLTRSIIKLKLIWQHWCLFWVATCTQCVPIFLNRQQISKIFRVATHERAIRQSGKIVKVDCDNFNFLNIFRRINKIISRAATSNEKRDTTNRYLTNDMRE